MWKYFKFLLKNPEKPTSLARFHSCPSLNRTPTTKVTTLRDDYINEAKKIIQDPNILINVVSRRVKQLKFGQKPLIESLERLNLEDIALREIIEGKISYELDTQEDQPKSE